MSYNNVPVFVNYIWFTLLSCNAIVYWLCLCGQMLLRVAVLLLWEKCLLLL